MPRPRPVWLAVRVFGISKNLKQGLMRNPGVVAPASDRGFHPRRESAPGFGEVGGSWVAGWFVPFPGGGSLSVGSLSPCSSVVSPGEEQKDTCPLGWLQKGLGVLVSSQGQPTTLGELRPLAGSLDALCCLGWAVQTPCPGVIRGVPATPQGGSERPNETR